MTKDEAKANRLDAKRKGLPHYLGRPCPKGHPGLRRVTGSHCVPCQRELKRLRHENGGAALTKFYKMLRNYGLTAGAYHAMWVAQGQRCAICHKAGLMPGERHVDHCHTSGRVRGLLCTSCNMGLGLFKDNPDALLRAVRYVCQ